MSGELKGAINHNWVNIKALPADSPRGPWKGQIAVDKTGHAIFPDPVWSLRAGMCDLSHDYCLEGKKTLRQLFAEFAPADDTQGSIAGGTPNDPLAYARFVGGRLGFVDIDSDLQLYTPSRKIDSRGQGPLIIPRMIRAIVENELLSGWLVADDLMNNAMLLYKLDYNK